jgi:hypothetical protein
MIKLPGKSILTKIVQPTTFVLIGAVARLLPHPANFAPIGAMALFGGTHMNKKQALILPILAMILSDALIGFDSLTMRVSVYGSFLLIVAMGFWLKKHLNYQNIAISSLAASTAFFVITNFSVWAFGSFYPKTAGGLWECFFLAIPFFRNTILGDFFYNTIFFGGYEFIAKIILDKKVVLKEVG